MTTPVKETNAMIAGMSPMIQPGTWHFVSIAKGATGQKSLVQSALACFDEPEGLSLIVDAATAKELGQGCDMPMAHILLQVTSALDGVGLTAAVAETLTRENMPCNVVAGHHHDHIFVPHARAEEAVALLRKRAKQAA